MNNEISRVAEAVPAPRPGTSNAAVEMLRAHAEVMAIAFDLAKAMVKTTMVPNHFRLKADDATAAILYGAELGLAPIQSLQQVVPVNGKPTVEARTMVGLLKAKKYRFNKVENTATIATVEGWSPDGKDHEIVTWTIEDAKTAEFVPQIDPKTGAYALNSNGKLQGNMKYLTQPRQMLYAKACAELCRQLAPDVLLGISYTREDLESEPDPEPVRAVSERIPSDDVPDDGADSPVVVQQWQPATEDSEPDPVEDRETDAGSAVEPKRTKKADLEEASELLDQIGATSQDDKRQFLRDLMDDDKITAAGLNTEQRDYLLTKLRTLVAERAATTNTGEPAEQDPPAGEGV